MHVEPQKEHAWLQKLVGEWTSEAECDMGPDKPKGVMRGTESIKAIGDLWIVGEGRSEMPGGPAGTMRITIGYDTAKKRFVGSWIGSMMTNMWVYEGELDASGKVLTLNTEGPLCMEGSPAGKTAKYRDVIEMKSDDHRVLSSWMQGENGKWTPIMTCHYRRK